MSTLGLAGLVTLAEFCPWCLTLKAQGWSSTLEIQALVVLTAKLRLTRFRFFVYSQRLPTAFGQSQLMSFKSLYKHNFLQDPDESLGIESLRVCL
jgi:hypothetical protein